MPVVKPIENIIDTDIAKVSLYFRSTKKFGKTTLFRDVVLDRFDGDFRKGYLLGCGAEKGYRLLDQLNVGQIKTFRDCVDTVNWLVEAKGKEHDVQMVAFDTADELIGLAEQYAIQVSNQEARLQADSSKKKTAKVCKTINGAFGGFHKGIDYTAYNLLAPLLAKLIDAGFGVWVLAHTKFKNVTDKGGLDEDGYMQLVANYDTTYDNMFGYVLDATITGVIDRQLDTVVVPQKNGEDKVKRFVKSKERRIYFRDTSNIDAGGRFADGAIPTYIPVNIMDPSTAHTFIKYIEDGIELSKVKNRDKRHYTDLELEEDGINVEEAAKLNGDIIEDNSFDETEDDLTDSLTGFADAEEIPDIEESVEYDIEELRSEIRSIVKTLDKAGKERLKAFMQEQHINLKDCTFEELTAIKALIS